MQKLKILNTKERKQVLKLIGQQWGDISKDVFSDLAFLLSPKNKIYVVNKDFALIDEKKLRVNSLGLYFGEIMKEEIRLSIEGSQLIGPYAKKNIVELNEEETKEWIKGEDLKKEDIKGVSGFVLIKSKNKKTGKYDFIGTGKFKEKENKILNFVPKVRRIMAD